MNKTELLEIIRTVVREEVNNSLPQLLMEVLAEKITSNQDTLAEVKAAPVSRAQVAPARRKPAVSLDAPLKQAPISAPKTFSSNPVLNAVLNETVGGVPLQEDVDAESAIDRINNLPPEVLQENAAVAQVDSALNRDYSKFMKAVAAKVKR